MFGKRHTDLPFGLYFWTPLLLVAAPYALRWAFGDASWLSGEQGVFEILTFLLLAAAVYFIVRTRATAIALHVTRLPVWLIVMLFGAVYFAGEEISWGQHLFFWETPDAWQNVNDQRETNLHSVHALFNQLLRALLTLAALIGGIIAPLYLRLRGIEPAVREVAGWLWPTIACTPVSVFVLLVRPLDRLIQPLVAGLPVDFHVSTGEMKECLLALFILFYAASLHRRLKTSASRTF